MRKKDLIKDIGSTFSQVNFDRKNNFRSFLVGAQKNQISTLAKAFESVEMSVHKKVMMKEKLILVQELDKSSVWQWVWYKKLVSGFVAFSFLAVIVNFPFERNQVAQAVSPVSVSAVSGSVRVIRLGQEIEVYPSFQLFASDKVVTQDGFVEVVFADKSVLRVKEDSHLVIDKVMNFAGRTDSTMTLKSGGFWFNAVGGANRNSEYNFRSSELLVEVDDDSVIAMEVNNVFGQVVVFAESAEVNYKTQESFQSSSLRKGDVIKVKREQDSLSVVDSVLLAEDLGQFQRIWYLDNLRKDQIYRQFLFDESLIASRSKVVVTPDSLWYPLKEAQRATRVAFTFDPVKKAEVKLQIADEKLHEAKILTNDGKTELAQKNLVEYKKAIDSVIQIASDVELVSGNEVSTRLKNEVRNLVEVHKQDIAGLSGDSNLKEGVLSSELKIAEVSGQADRVRLLQLDSRLDDLKKSELVSDMQNATNADLDITGQVSFENMENAVNLLKDFSSVITSVENTDLESVKIISDQLPVINELKSRMGDENSELVSEINLVLRNLGVTNIVESEIVEDDKTQAVTDAGVVISTIQINNLDLQE